MAGRPKSPTRELKTLDDANSALRGLLLSTVELEKLQGSLDLARAAATAKFEKDIDAEKSQIADLTAQLQQWFLVHAERPTGHDARKSLKLAYGVIGERTGNPTLKPLNRKWTWAAICAKLRGIYGAQYFHPAPPPAPDKEKIRTELSVDQLKNCGLMVDREEKFYVELDRTSLGDAK